jgi:phenylalanine-4-hydroxylase
VTSRAYFETYSQEALMATASGYSPVIESTSGLRVELDRDHPGFSDPAYRTRRDEIASISASHRLGQPITPIEYTEPEHEVWRIVSRELAPKHDRYACSAYNEASSLLDLPRDHVPQLDEVSELLTPLTGFAYQPVAGLAPLRDFYGAFAERRFFSTQYLRHDSTPLYTPEPDIIHEVVGHANQLANPSFAAICEEVGKAVGRTENAGALAFMSRVFWFTLEFGVVLEDGEPKAYGAGILSSFGELDVFQQAEIRALDFAEMGSTEYDITRYQPVLYASASFGELVDELMGFYGTYDDEVYERLA